MDQPSHFSPQVADDRVSGLWEIQIPIAAALAPATAFWLLGLITPLIAKQGDNSPTWAVVLMWCLEFIGIAAMAVVLLMRYDIASKQLSDHTGGNPSAWRRITFVLAIAMLLVFDVSVNLAAAFAGGGVLLALGIPAFFAYLAFGRLSLMGLGRTATSVDPPHP